MTDDLSDTIAVACRTRKERREDARRRLGLATLLCVGVAPFYLNGLYNAPLAAASPAAFWIAELCAWAVLPMALIIIGHKCRLASLTDLGLTTRICGRQLPGVLLALVVIMPVLLFRLDLSVAQWAYPTLPNGWTVPEFRYKDMIPQPGPMTGWLRLLAVLHFSVSAAVVEELYYRAAFDRLFPRGWIGGVSYAVISSVIFAGAHFEGGLPNVAEAFTFGVVAAVFFRMTGNLWPLILGHVVTDWYWLTGGMVGTT